MNGDIECFKDDTAAQPPVSWYDAGKKEYLIQADDGHWLSLNESQYKRELRICGIASKCEVNSLASTQDTVMSALQKQRYVSWAGPLAGSDAGYQVSCGTKILVTTTPRVPQPVPGEWPVLRAFIDCVLGGEFAEQQTTCFFGWLKVAYTALLAGKKQPGQAVVFCGPHGCGKSLLQHVITEVLGGRVAKPYQNMTGGTSFNLDLFGAEHLMVEDEAPSTDTRARRAFGNAIKNVTVNVDQRLHGKNRDAIMMRPFWRMSISINDEPENVMVLPPVDDSIEDKLIIFMSKSNPLPMPTATIEQRTAFWGTLMSELPAFLDFLVKMEIPKEWVSDRFGIKHFHHPEILMMLDDVAPESRLLALIDSVLFNEDTTGSSAVVQSHRVFEGTAEVIGSTLTSGQSGFDYEARRLLSWSNACGTYLGRLAKKFPERVQQSRSAESRVWRIAAPGCTLTEEGAEANG